MTMPGFLEGIIMPQARTRTKKPRTPKATASNGKLSAPTDDVLTLSEAAAYLRVSETDLMRLVHDEALPGRRLGTEWRFLKSAIQDWLRTPPMPGSREVVLSTIGSLKDDPCLEE